MLGQVRLNDGSGSGACQRLRQTTNALLDEPVKSCARDGEVSCAHLAAQPPREAHHLEGTVGSVLSIRGGSSCRQRLENRLTQSGGRWRSVVNPSHSRQVHQARAGKPRIVCPMAQRELQLVLELAALER